MFILAFLLGIPSEFLVASNRSEGFPRSITGLIMWTECLGSEEVGVEEGGLGRSSLLAKHESGSFVFTVRTRTVSTQDSIREAPSQMRRGWRLCSHPTSHTFITPPFSAWKRLLIPQNSFSMGSAFVRFFYWSLLQCSLSPTRASPSPLLPQSLRLPCLRPRRPKATSCTRG